MPAGTLKLLINGMETSVNEGATILEAAEAIGVYIPTLCYHPDLPTPKMAEPAEFIYRGADKLVNELHGLAFEGCRLCLVEVSGIDDLVLACCAQALDGMRVYTESERVREARKAELMRILAKHPHACLVCAQKEGCPREPCSENVPVEERCCQKLGNCELERVADYVGIREDTPRYVPRGLPVIEGEPLFTRNYNLCVGCTRCVRACKWLRDVGVLGFVYVGGEVIVGSVAPTLMDSNCRFCGACVEVCPTGALMDKRPISARREVDLVPCKYACPAGVDVPRYVKLICEGRFSDAVDVVRESLPLPNVLARACSRPCEAVCKRKDIDEAISICGLKRFIMERDEGLWRQKLKALRPSGKRVAVIGSGPSGLSAAHYLMRLGHEVTVFEAMPELGGMMRYGVQEYRLPKDIVKADVFDIVNRGIAVKTGVALGRDFTIESLKRDGFDAILIAVGLQDCRGLAVEGSELNGLVGALDLLRDVRLGKISSIRGRVLVVGGGNVAMDAALTALRLGAEEVHVACLEKPDEMPAFPWEVQQAVEEGVKIHNSYGVKRIIGRDGRVSAVELMRCLSVLDERGRFNPSFDEGQTMVVDADVLILAIGQVPNSLWRSGNRPDVSDAGLIKVNPITMETSIPGTFACGDIVNGPTSIVEALASGKRAAIAIDKYLGGAGVIENGLIEHETPDPKLGMIEGFAHKRRVEMPCLPIESRKGSFAEVELGYDESMAKEEASRCLRCDLRLYIRAAPKPPERWAPFNEGSLASVPEVEGVYQLLDDKKNVIYIKGTANLRKELEHQLKVNVKAKYFTYEEAKMYTVRESELLQRYVRRHGRMPEQNVGVEEELY